MTGLESALILLGRFALSAFFLWTALEKIKHWNRAGELLKKKKFPYVTYVLPTIVVLEVVGGLSLFVGFYCRLGAFLLLVSMVPHLYKMHDFWKMSDGEEKVKERLFFMKDIAIIGGLLILLAIGSGHFAINA